MTKTRTKVKIGMKERDLFKNYLEANLASLDNW